MSWFLWLSLFEGIFPERIFGLHCFPPSANLLSCPNSLFSIFFIGKALHGSYIDVWHHLFCFCVPGQPPCTSLSWELQGLSFFWTLTVSLSPREERNIQSKSWQSYLEFSAWCSYCSTGQQAQNWGKTIIMQQVFWSVAAFDPFLVKW